MSFRDFLSEGYVINDDKGIVSKLSREVYILNHINNDFKYLHLNSNGPIFEILHKRFEDYYYHLNQDIDYLCEVDEKGHMIIKKLYFDPFMDMCNREILSYSIAKQPSAQGVLSALEKCRKLVKDNDAITSRLDETAMYWQKEYSYLLKRMTK